MAAINTVELRGAENTYQFRFGANAWCRLEQLTGLRYPQLVRALNEAEPAAVMLRHFIQAGLVEPANPNDETAGLIIDDLGGLGVVASGLNLAASAAAAVVASEPNAAEDTGSGILPARDPVPDAIASVN